MMIGLGSAWDVVSDAADTAVAVARAEGETQMAYFRGELPWYCTAAKTLLPVVPSFWFSGCVPLERMPSTPIQRVTPAAPITANQMTTPGAWTPDELSAYTAREVQVRQDEATRTRQESNTDPMPDGSVGWLALGVAAVGVLAVMSFLRR